MKNNPEIELQRFQEKYQKLMLGDNETIGLINMSNHLHETAKQVNYPPLTTIVAEVGASE